MKKKNYKKIAKSVIDLEIKALKKLKNSKARFVALEKLFLISEIYRNTPY